jgi:hypothetical protein
MAVVTIYRLAEEILTMINGGNIKPSQNISINAIKIAIGQSINALLKTEQLNVNEKMREKIPNGTVLAFYENIEVESYNGKSRCKLPIKPIKLQKNMGIWGIYPKFDTQEDYRFDEEFIPTEMGQIGLLKSQPLLNDLGLTWYENYGMECIFNKDLKLLFPNIKLAMRLVIMDINQYGDYDPLPVLPEHEFLIKEQIFKLYTGIGIADKLVDVTSSFQKNVPIQQQRQIK